MTLTPRRVLLALVMACLVAPVFLPSVAADHVYSHRYVVYGRLIDVDGNPIPGVDVSVGVDETVTVEGLCADQPNTETDAWGKTTTIRRTNAYGEFFYCFHVHGVSRGTRAEVHVEYEEWKESVRVDPFFRKNFVVLQTTNATGEATEEFTESYLVSGRVWYGKQNTRLEGVGVYGLTYDDQNVTVAFETADGQTITEETTTNGYGDFAVRVPVTDVAGAKFTVTAGGESRTYDADATARASDLEFEISNPDNPLLTALKVGGGIVLVGAVVAGGAIAYKKASAQREVAKARAQSTRKRAQK